MIDFGDFSLVFIIFSVPFHQSLGFLLSVELRERWIQIFFFFARPLLCLIFSSPQRDHSFLMHQTVHLDPLSSRYCIVITSVVWKEAHCITNCEPWKMSSVWGKTVLLTFISRTVLSSRCICSRVLLPSTWNCGVFSHYGRWVVTWLAVVAISEPSMRSWSLAWDLAPEWVGWQQDRSILALAPLFSGGPRGDRGLASWGGIEQLQYSTYDGQLALQFHNHTDG